MAALVSAGEVEVSAFAVSWRRRHVLDGRVPHGARVVGRAMPARPLQLAWRHSETPPVEWFIGATDVVHGTNFVVPPARSAARIVTVHDLTVVRYPEMCEPETLRFPALVRRAVSHGAWVHTPSKYVAEEVVEAFGIDPGRVRAVHHGTPRVSPRPSAEPVPEGLPGGLPEGTRRYVLAIGTAEPRKDLPGLVRAFDSIAGNPELGDVALVIVGQAGWGSDALESAVAGSRFRSRIALAGYVADLGGVLAGATVLAYPSLYEGFGLPTLEAMAAGVPVVTTTAGALPEVVGEAALLVSPGATEELAEALESVLTDEVQRRGLAERGLQRASLFRWEACARGLTDLYREAVDQRR
jgi:glycosyltransferase involved in cell wall biosynthesis